MTRKWITAVLVATILFATSHKVYAPACLPLLCFFKGFAGIGLVGYAIWLYRCDTEWNLWMITSDDEPPWYLASQQNKATIAKTLDQSRNEQVQFCEGPSHDAEDMKFRAAINNKTPLNAVFACGPSGTLPGPSRTNIFATIEQSVDGGSYVAAVTKPIDEMFPVVALTANGTNGFTREQMNELRFATVLPHPPGTTTVLFRSIITNLPAAKPEIQPVPVDLDVVPPVEWVSHLFVPYPGTGFTSLVREDGSGWVFENGFPMCSCPAGSLDIHKVYDELGALSPVCTNDKGCLDIKIWCIPVRPYCSQFKSPNIEAGRWLYNLIRERRQ